MRSMTGFGKGQASREDILVTVELKSVNNRYFDVNVHIPCKYNYIAEEIKKQIKSFGLRGKLDAYVQIENGKSASKVNVDMQLASEYYNVLKEISNNLHVNSELTAHIIASCPDVISVKNLDEDMDTISELACNATEEALNSLMAMQEIEGNNLAKSIKAINSHMLNIIDEIAQNEENTIEVYFNKLKSKLRDLIDEVTDISDDRIMLEAALYAEKSCVDEEITRLRSHIQQLSELLYEDSLIGKKIDFLIQELNREVNTIGSKAKELDITNKVIELKYSIEKIREQIQNIQ